MHFRGVQLCFSSVMCAIYSEAMATLPLIKILLFAYDITSCRLTKYMLLITVKNDDECLRWENNLPRKNMYQNYIGFSNKRINEAAQKGCGLQANASIFIANGKREHLS